MLQSRLANCVHHSQQALAEVRANRLEQVSGELEGLGVRHIPLECDIARREAMLADNK